MQTYHVHISGLVQGVGFRPFVCSLAREMNIEGWVCNSTNGVHIEINATESECRDFYARLLKNPPANAVITGHSIIKTELKQFNSFTIESSTSESLPDLLITPDMAICPGCKREVLDKYNRRYHYPFTIIARKSTMIYGMKGITAKRIAAQIVQYLCIYQMEGEK